MDISAFNPREVPETQEKNDMKAFAMSAIDLFVDEMLSGEMVFKKSPLDDDHQYFESGKTYDYTMAELWSKFVEFCATGKAGKSNNNSETNILSRYSQKLSNQR